MAEVPKWFSIKLGINGSPSKLVRVFISVRIDRKHTISLVVSVRPSARPPVRVELFTHWTDFHEICYSGTFRKSVKKTEV
jgi:hypothetical protein